MALYNVKDFGATGDGITNDTAAIQAAVNAARADGGGEVYVPAGTYIVTGHNEPSDGAIMLYDNIRFYGDGMGQTNIKVADGWGMKMTGIIRTEYGVSTNNVTVDNLTLDGNRANVTAKVDGWFNGYAPGKEGHDSNIILDHMEIKNCSGYGFDPHEQTWNLTISNSVSHGNGLDGFVADYIVGGTYINNIAYNNDRHGFNIVTSTSNLTVTGNMAYDNGAHGIVVQRGSENIAWVHDIIISNNKIYQNALEGVLLKLTNYITLDGNEIYENGKGGVRLYGTDHNTIINNNIHDNSTSKPDAYEEIRLQSYDETTGVSGNFYTTTNNIIRNNILGDADSDSNFGIREIADGTDFNTFTLNIIKGYSIDAVALAGANSTWDRYDPTDTSGDDVFVGTILADAIDGGLGNDTIDGGAGRDTLTGGAGTDTFLFSDTSHSTDASAQDRITDFEIGIDKLDVSALGFTNLTNTAVTSAGQLRLAYSASSNRTYVRSEQSPFEILLQGDYRAMTATDFIFAKPLLDQLINGSTAKDVLIGGVGNDTLIGGASADTLTGGEGEDVFRFTSISESSKTSKSIDGITDFVSNEDHIDLRGLGFTSLVSSVKTLAGELRLAYSSTSDRTYIRSDQADLEIYVKGDVRGSMKNSDFIFQDADINVGSKINGTNVADTLLGGTGDDTISGMDGDDVINGDAGHDRITATSGTDTLTGGAGNDLFIFDATGGVITDFTDRQDRIDLRIFDVAMGNIVQTAVGVDTTLYVFNAGGTLLAHITLLNFTGVLDSNDIIV